MSKRIKGWVARQESNEVTEIASLEKHDTIVNLHGCFAPMGQLLTPARSMPWAGGINQYVRLPY